MRIIALLGGPSLSELGTAHDVQMFFDCVEKYVTRGTSDEKWKLITDRLYRRYLRIEELPAAAELMSDIKREFEKISPVDAELGERLDGISRLDLNQQTLAQVFARFFDKFSESKEGIELFFKRWNKYEPLQIVIGDMPEFMNDKLRKLDQYDKLTGEPFWKQ